MIDPYYTWFFRIGSQAARWPMLSDLTEKA